MTVVAGPAVTSRERKALTGVGSGLGEGDGGTGDGDAAGALGVGVASSAATTGAVRRTQKGTTTRDRRKRMKSGNGSRPRLVTPAAMGWTRPSWAPGTSIPDRERPAGVGAGRGSRRG